MHTHAFHNVWRRPAAQIWTLVAARLGATVGDRCVGEMTGADRALISSLEGFEDLQLIGRLQLAQHGIAKGDVVICVTEGMCDSIHAAHDSNVYELHYRLVRIVTTISSQILQRLLCFHSSDASTLA
jgi:hypothetical protein